MRPQATEYIRTESFALRHSEKTGLGKALAGGVRAHPGQSGFRILTTGSESLDMRLALIRAAEKTIDLQYYAIHDDVTSNLLLEAILRAAARGVRVRFLIDNITMHDIGDSLSVLDHNKNIDIRVFNPLTTRDQPLLAKIVTPIVDMEQATKRMHNKALISDNQMAILGGRNLGDEYFDANADVGFKDLDILAAGPITDKISHSFDQYWNGKESFPIATINYPATDPKALDKIKIKLKENWDKHLQTADGKRMLESRLAERLKDADVKLTWARVELAADDPVKINKPEEHVVSKPLNRMVNLVDQGRSEFIVVSPYFVPRQVGVDWLSSLVKRGMRVRVLTNSLASTDVVAVHTGYRRYRRDVVRNGIELYEMKAIDNKRPKQRLFGASAPATASLHSKVYVVDRKDVIIGSFNFDPRSIELNTELALIIHSPDLAAQVLQMFNDSISADSSYKVSLDDRLLTWQTKEKGKAKYYHREPKAGLWRRVQLLFISLLPIENQL